MQLPPPPASPADRQLIRCVIRLCLPSPALPPGPNREAKKALEAYWSGATDAAALLEATAAVEASAWRAQAAAGVERVGLDGTLYDQVLDASFQLGLVPPRFKVRLQRPAAGAPPSACLPAGRAGDARARSKGAPRFGARRGGC